MSGEDAVRKASAQFYTALNTMLNGDAGKLSDIWSHSDTVMAMHPIGGRQVGWDNVGKSFSKVATMASKGRVTLDDQAIQVMGDIVFEVGVERGNVTFAGTDVIMEHRVTNIYRKEDGHWKIVHHHTDLSPALIDALKQPSVAK